MRHAEGDDHLVLPERQRVHERRLDLIRKDHGVGLHQADLRRVLQADGSGQFQVVEFLLKPFAQTCEIICFLRVFGQTGLCRLCLERREFFIVRFVESDAAGRDVHGQFLEIRLVVLEQSFLHCNILQQSLLMLFEDLCDVFDVGLYLAVVGLDLLCLFLSFFEEGKESLALCRIDFEIRYQVGERLADLIHISGPYLLQSCFREIGQSLLRACAVCNDNVRIMQVDSLREVIDLLHFFLGKRLQSEFFYLFFLDFRLRRIFDFFERFQ